MKSAAELEFFKARAGFRVNKDHIEKIDFQDLIYAVVNWPNSELYGAFVCIIR